MEAIRARAYTGNLRCNGPVSSKLLNKHFLFTFSFNILHFYLGEEGGGDGSNVFYLQFLPLYNRCSSAVTLRSN